MKNFLPEVLAVLLLVLVVLGLVHQQMTPADVWFHFTQLKNHETIMACCTFAAVALIVGKYMGRIRYYKGNRKCRDIK